MDTQNDGLEKLWQLLVSMLDLWGVGKEKSDTTWVWPPSQDASDHQDDSTYLATDSKLNFHLPLLLSRDNWVYP